MLSAKDTRAACVHKPQPLFPTPLQAHLTMRTHKHRAGLLSTTGQSTNFVLCVALPVAPGTTADDWVLQGTALLCTRDD
jgi:hypothetical protein